MEFEWDERKHRENILKHGIRFEDAARIFDGFTIDAIDDRKDYGEVRVISVGKVGAVVLIAVVHTDRDGVRRIISARQANTKERSRYAEALRKALDA